MAADFPLPGHLVWPYPTQRCQRAECPDPVLTVETEAVLFTDRGSGKFLVFCGSCSLIVELHAADRFALFPG